MNKETAAEFLPLVQALADGKTIQVKHTLGIWKDFIAPSFSCSPEDYRIKPEPREWVIFTDGESIYHKGPSDCDDVRVSYGKNTALKAVRVREILD